MKLTPLTKNLTLSTPYYRRWRFKGFLIVIGFLSVFYTNFSAANTEQPPVLVELFSSQGCPHCPKAEVLFKDVAAMENVIALNCHIDYMRVKDKSLPKPICTERQTFYKERMGNSTHYTPQMVVNGHMDVVGYKKDQVSAALLKGRADRIARIDIRRIGQGAYQFTLPPMNVAGEAQLWMAQIDKPHIKNFKGQRMAYTNIVSAMEPLGPWRGQAFVKAIAPVMGSDARGFILFAQDTKSGKIIAAGKIMP